MASPGGTLLLLFAGGAGPTAYGDLYGAVRARLLASAGLSALSGVWLHEAPRGAAFPYAVLAPVDETPAYNTRADGYLTTGHFDVSVFATPSALAARQLEAAAATALNDATSLGFADGTLAKLRRAGRQFGLDPAKAPGGADVWRATGTYEFMCNRTF